MSRLNATADLMNSTLSGRASAAGYSFANPTSRFVGHAVCDNPEYLNGLSNPIVESFHPNRLGHSSGYTPVVSPLVTGATVTASPALMTKAAGSSARLADQQRRYASLDASIAPELFVAPDLTTPAAKAAAKKAGVDLRSRASIDAADRRYAAAQARAFLAR